VHSDQGWKPTVDDPGSLSQTIGFGRRVDGTDAMKSQCLQIARENVEQAHKILTEGPHPTTAVLQLELALLHLGNAVALIFDRDIEGKEDKYGLHNASARALVAFCRDEQPGLLDIARFAARFVRGRNDYAYRHQNVNVQDLKRLYTACGKLYSGLEPMIREQKHWPLPD
jgi:hypothetical protein